MRDRLPQRKTNPFPYSDSNKRYHTFDYYLRKKYGEKCAVIPLDAGFSCPNIDGTRGVGGCIYCSGRGSGDFAGDCRESLALQYARQRAAIASKWSCRRFLPYLQAHTNTHAPIGRLREVYTELAALPDAAALHIATRADAIDPERAALLAELAEEHDLTVELGLQSIFDETARRINRCHTYKEFCEGFAQLRAASKRIRISVHLINGLPGEGRDEMLASAREVGALGVDEIKIHLLYVLSGTPLARIYLDGGYTPMTEEDYVETVAEQLRLLPAETVVGRLTGDAPRDALLAPLWSLRKMRILNAIDRRLFETDTVQGSHFGGADEVARKAL